MTAPLVIGLTGNIATGKSNVARMLADLGALTIDADKVAHEVMEPGTPAHAAIVAVFGEEVLGTGGSIDRARLGEVVFSDSAALGQLERIVHPAVIAVIDRRIEAATAPVVVEAIKLIEAGMAARYDSLWVTTCPREEQIRRLVDSRGLSREEAALRVDAQPPQEEKVARADVVIDTRGTLDDTRAQVRAAWENARNGL